MVRCETVTAPHFRTAVPGHFGLKPLRPGTPDRPNQFVFTWAPRAGLHSLAIILTLALVSTLKELSASTAIKILPESVTLKRIAWNCKNLRKCQYHNQTNCHEV